MKKQVEKLMFIAIGGLIAIIAYSLGNINKDTATAQEDVPIIDLIRCRKLEVIGKNGKTVASLGTLELELEKIMGILPGGTLRLFNGDGTQSATLSPGVLTLSDDDGSALLSETFCF